MSAVIDVYTPWREDSASLLQRHVGRAEQLSAIRAAVEAFAKGQRQTHLYFFGARGMGKSHLLAMARTEIEAVLGAAHITLATVPEDISELASADAILARIAEILAGPRWVRWGIRAEVIALPKGPMVIVFEGLDRQLQALSEDERRKLRGLFDERGPFLLVGTGVSLSEVFSDRDTAFYGAFSPWPVGPLEDGEAACLLDGVAGETARVEEWPPRRRALVTLSGGSPRTLVALGRACALAPQAWASEHLYAVVQQFTSHYQQRFRDLPQQQQAVVELLAMAPRELSPTEIGLELRISASHASGLCHRLAAGGVVQGRSDGRFSWYRLSDPLFRFWWEYRNAPWEQTRIGWLARLLEAVLAPEDLVARWMENPAPDLQGAVIEVLNRNQRKNTAVWDKLAEEYGQVLRSGDHPRRAEILRRAQKNPPPISQLVLMAGQVSPADLEAKAELEPLLRRKDLGVVSIAWSFEHALTHEERPREAFGLFIQRAAPRSGGPVAPRAAWDLCLRIVRRALGTVDPRGRPWVLEWAETAALAQIPVLRGIFLLQGKRTAHEPLLSPDDVLLFGMQSVDIDWGMLLVGATRRRHEGLMRALLRQAIARARAPLLPLCPLPGVIVPAAGDVWLALVAKALRDWPTAWPTILTWAASFATGSAQAWEVLLEALSASVRLRQALPPAPTRASPSLGVALVALGKNAPQRLDQIATALPERSLEALEATRAKALAAQMAERQTARLYPELAELAHLLEQPPGR